jgi:hypothetical protein
MVFTGMAMRRTVITNALKVGGKTVNRVITDGLMLLPLSPVDLVWGV